MKINNYEELLSFRQSFLDAGDNVPALWSHLALTFYFENDVDCWADAIYLCVVVGDISVLQAVITCSLKYCGILAYSTAKMQRPKIFTAISDELDAFVVEANAAVRAEKPYQPGEAIGEAEILFSQGILRMQPNANL